jgi:CHAT domain-containing protein
MKLHNQVPSKLCSTVSNLTFYISPWGLVDKLLTLLDIIENDAPHAKFAFFSACHTAIDDEEIPDEIIHLAAGLEFLGFNSVIGTLWAVDDAAKQHAMDVFYKLILDNLEDGRVVDCMKAARALKYSTSTMKKNVPLKQRFF